MPQITRWMGKTPAGRGRRTGQRGSPGCPLLASALAAAEASVAAKYLFYQMQGGQGAVPLLHHRRAGAFRHVGTDDSGGGEIGRRSLRAPFALIRN